MTPTFVDSYIPAAEDTISRFETELGRTLPPAYRLFLQQTNGGQPIPDCFRSKAGRIHAFPFWYGLDYAADEGPYNLLLRYKVGQLLVKMPDSLMCIARSHDGDLLFISLEEPDYGRIYVWFHDLHPQQIWDRGPASESDAERLTRMGMDVMADELTSLLASAVSESERQVHVQQQLERLGLPGFKD